MKKILSCCPVASIESMHLIPADFQFQPGKPVSALKTQVWWLQESESTVCMRDASQPIQFLNHYTDREGYLSSVDQAIRDCTHLCKGYELKTTSTESVFIKIDITLTPVFELFSQEVKFSWDKKTNWRQYEVVSNDWCQIQYPDHPISTHNVVKPVKNKKLVDNEVIWHSNQSIDQAMEGVKAFKEKWALNGLKESLTERKK
ncbi:hypothetical protein NBRC116188_24170 [Oceaniserpentilla sp. 4NH20-0058]|uniref:hypothetical protein n=1 Tax=Oceaniserpentilla sp. 4NH20-0058 TaxID=3127660 RepID=UPI00310908AF